MCFTRLSAQSYHYVSDDSWEVTTTQQTTTAWTTTSGAWTNSKYSGFNSDCPTYASGVAIASPMWYTPITLGSCLTNPNNTLPASANSNQWVYFRKTFSLTGTNATTFSLHVKADDTVLVYINGNRITSSAPGGEVNTSTINPAWLTCGTNYIAIQAANYNGSGNADANTCACWWVSCNFSITCAPIVLTPTINLSCNGTNNASISVTASGGIPSYTYQWLDGPTGSTRTGLAPGTYYLGVTDSKGCNTTGTYTITKPAVLSATATVTKNVSCYGGSNGAASIAVSGGTPGYNYTWSPSASGSNPTALSAGSYNVTVKDANNCSLVKSVTVTQPAAFSASVSVTSSSKACPCNGAATITPSGGTWPYAYSWNGTSGSASMSGLCGGSYAVTVTDIAGCTYPVTVSVPGTAALSVSVSSACFSANAPSAASLTATVTGGNSAFTYSWSASGPASGTIVGTTTAATITAYYPTASGAGKCTRYNVTVTDSKGCTVTAYTDVCTADACKTNNSVDLSSLGEIASTDNILQVYPNPSSDHISVSYHADALQSGSIRLIDALGRVVYTCEVSGASGVKDVDVASLAVGTYIVVLDSAGHNIGITNIVKR
ncbi:MAG: T9SS type A sorting domain-containing protein [Bacteroidetes bacterium]|nr:T9SS type A sorting domain-containing protein [Bacteroidota bacterium]